MSRGIRAEVIPTSITRIRLAQNGALLPARQRIPARVWTYVWHKPVRVRLDDGEKARYARRLHWHSVAGNVAKIPVSMVVSLVISMVLPNVLIVQATLWGMALGHQALLFVHILRWRWGGVVVTNKRLLEVSGVWHKTVAASHLQLITDSEAIQNPIQQRFGYGTVRIESGGRHSDGSPREYLRFVQDPELVHSLISPQPVNYR